MPATLQWLLDSDPSIRWQVMQDLMDESPATVSAERSRVATEGWGARLLAQQNPDGSWGSGEPQPKWHSTLYTLLLLRDMGLDPLSDPSCAAVSLLCEGFTWGEEFGDLPFFEGEVEPCINGGVLALGGYFGQPSDRLLARLLSEQLPDGGWNCSAPPSQRSSFHTTLCVLDGLLEYERARGVTPAVTEARQRGEQYLLQRSLFRRLSTGEVINPNWTANFAFPPTWHYDILRALNHFRNAGYTPDERMAEAVERVAAARQPDGRWLHTAPRLRPPYWWGSPIDFPLDASEGEPSRWNTLRALRVMRWADGIARSR